MTKLAALIFTLVVILLTLCGCVWQPYAEQTITSSSNSVNNPNSNASPSFNETRKLYVSGAVERDGFADVPLVADRKTVLEIVGVASCAALPDNINVLLSAQEQVLIVNFVWNGKVCQSVNVNSPYVSQRQSFDGVSDDVIDRLADYVAKHGAISNREQLKLALEGDYDDNYYKFYIDVSDYA